MLYSNGADLRADVNIEFDISPSKTYIQIIYGMKPQQKALIKERQINLRALLQQLSDHPANSIFSQGGSTQRDL